MATRETCPFLTLPPMKLLQIWLPSSLWCKTHFSRQLSCWSLRCSWSIACRRCSNYIFILNLTSGFNGLGKDNYQMRREAFKFRDLVRLILETLSKCIAVKGSRGCIHLWLSVSTVSRSYEFSGVIHVTPFHRPFRKAFVRIRRYDLLYL